MGRFPKKPFVSDPQLFLDYYTKQAGVGFVPVVGLGNHFGSLQSRVIPLGKSKKRKNLKKLKSFKQVIVSHTQAGADRAKAELERKRLLEKEAEERHTKQKTAVKKKTAPKKKARTTKKKTVPKIRKERDLLG